MADALEPGPRPEEPPNHERLDSWKSIAAYLNRSVRTVQLWEKEEGLPVHRHLHKKQGSVYAYRLELDSWWSQHRLRLEPTPPPSSRLGGKRAVAVGGVLAVALTAGLFLSRPSIVEEQLTRPIQTALDVPRESDPMLERELKELTFTSLDAYHYYVEGVRFYYEHKPKEALVLFEKAVDLDPGFTMALFRIGNMYANWSRPEEAEPYYQRTLANLDRVTPRERYYIEAVYQLRHGQGGADRSIAASEKALELFPDDDMMRYVLALQYGEMERYAEASDHLDILRRRAPTHAFVVNEYMYNQVALGEFEKSRRALETNIRDAREDSEHARALISLAKNYVYWGKYAEAMRALREADAIRADVDPVASIGVEWLLGVSTEDFPLAEKATDELSASSDPFYRWLGSFRRAIVELYGGRSVESLKLIEKAVASHVGGGIVRARVHPLASHVLLESGDPAGALEWARTARAEGRGDVTEWEGLFFEAMAQAKLGRLEEAAAIGEGLRRAAESLPTEKEKRRHHHLLGELALARGDSLRAIRELTKAQSMLSPRGVVIFPRYVPEHVPIWYSLAQAHMAAGQEEEAFRWFRRIVESPAERTDWPIFFVRSYYFLGKIHESRGETEAARKSYRRFFDFWKDGDLDRQRVAEVENKLRVLDPSHFAQRVAVH